MKQILPVMFSLVAVQNKEGEFGVVEVFRYFFFRIKTEIGRTNLNIFRFFFLNIEKKTLRYKKVIKKLQYSKAIKANLAS